MTGGGSCLYDHPNEKREKKREQATPHPIRRNAADLDRPPNFTEDRTRGGEANTSQQENISQTLDVIRARCRQSPRADHDPRYTPPGPYTAIYRKNHSTGKREDNSSGRYTREGVRFNFFRTFGRSSILPRHARARGYYVRGVLYAIFATLKKRAADVKTPREGTP